MKKSLFWLLALVLSPIAVLVIITPMDSQKQYLFGRLSIGILFLMGFSKKRSISVIMVVTSLLMSTRYMYFRLTQTLHFNSTIETVLGMGLFLAEVYIWVMLLLNYLQQHYPELYLVSSTTKVLTDPQAFQAEVRRPEFRYVVPDFRLNKSFDALDTLSQPEKDKVEFLCNECCWFGCTERRRCYEAVSRKNLGEVCEHRCTAPGAQEGYRFSKAMENPGFIGTADIRERYLPLGFSNFKLEGRGLGSALVLEFLLYYLTRPEYQIHVREAIYLDNMLDLF